MPFKEAGIPANERDECRLGTFRVSLLAINGSCAAVTRR